MLGGTLRFAAKGWIKELYIDPVYHFTYFGFDWVKPLGETGMYAIFVVMGLSALFVALGFAYRISSTLFFLSFTYIELIDKTTYLNHYYFVSLVSFLMILLPAHRYFSIDVYLKPRIKQTLTPGWNIDIIKLQLGIVYVFAGVAKLNYDWLFRAMPLTIWLPANSDLPIIGWLFDYRWVAFAFSWFAMLYDLFIPFLLLNKRTRPIAYVLVLVFHILTSIMFPIGMFPYIMVLATLIFFPAAAYEKIIDKISLLFRARKNESTSSRVATNSFQRKIMLGFLSAFFIVQLLLPFRYLLYPGKLFWTEEGYRFSWRVMLMEKAGTTFFYVKDAKSGKESELGACGYLTKQQEKMMSTQPDMILQFAHFLAEDFKSKGYEDPQVRAQSFVTLNGSGSRPFIDENVDLAKEPINLSHKTWVLPFEQNANVIAGR